MSKQDFPRIKYEEDKPVFDSPAEYVQNYLKEIDNLRYSNLTENFILQYKFILGEMCEYVTLIAFENVSFEPKFTKFFINEDAIEILVLRVCIMNSFGDVPFYCKSRLDYMRDLTFFVNNPVHGYPVDPYLVKENWMRM